MKAYLFLPLLCFTIPPVATAQVSKPFLLQKPIDCELGKTCEIQQYVDHDPGPGAVDYRCGSRVYDGHDGTDFRLPDKAAQARGVSVFAAASLVKGVECGNGVLIKHADGWETQYCHMRQGSVTVHAGQLVKAGQVLGLVGQSGEAQFVHLHLTVRHNGKAVDPFGQDAACHADASLVNSLWAPSVRAQMAYKVRSALDMGFATTAVSVTDVETGDIPGPKRSSPALVVYVLAIGMKLGDTQSLVLKGPDGQIISQSDIPSLDHNKAQYQLFVGKKLHGDAWPAGRYTGHYTVMHDGKAVYDKAAIIDLK